MYKHLLVVASAVSVLAAEPALAQYRDQSRTGRAAQDVARTVEEAARAVGTIRDAFDRSLYEARYHGPERFAIEACRPEVERYGRMRIDEVQPYKHRGFKIYGVTEGYRGIYGQDRRNDFGPRSFECAVGDDGRVKVKMKRFGR